MRRKFLYYRCSYDCYLLFSAALSTLSNIWGVYLVNRLTIGIGVSYLQPSFKLLLACFTPLARGGIVYTCWRNWDNSRFFYGKHRNSRVKCFVCHYLFMAIFSSMCISPLLFLSFFFYRLGCFFVVVLVKRQTERVFCKVESMRENMTAKLQCCFKSLYVLRIFFETCRWELWKTRFLLIFLIERRRDWGLLLELRFFEANIFSRLYYVAFEFSTGMNLY